MIKRLTLLLTLSLLFSATSIADEDTRQKVEFPKMMQTSYDVQYAGSSSDY